MNYWINIFVHNKDDGIKKYIKNSKLHICDEFLDIGKQYTCFNSSKGIRYNYYKFEICLDTLKQINMLNNIFDFFIGHEWPFYIEEKVDFTLYDVDKDLYHKSGYWILNSNFRDNSYVTNDAFYLSKKGRYLVLAHDNKFIEHVNSLCSQAIQFFFINIPVHKDLYLVEFLFDKCKKNMSKENFDTLIMNLFTSITLDVIENHGILFFKLMHKYNILNEYISFLNTSIRGLYLNYKDFVNKCLELNQTDVLDYLKKYGLSLKINKKILISMIENDNIETFNYTIANIIINNKTIQKMIEGSGEFITKEYVEILFNNGKLDSENLELLKKSIKNNPHKNLKKYVKKLILNEKN